MHDFRAGLSSAPVLATQFWRPSFGDPVKLVEADASVRRPIFFRMGRFARLRVANQAMGQG